ncbi:MAG TPA: hypothetical protein VFH82_00445 [Gemmatimonadota bacterium]|nr:hypothetical protein [Gemmatimonadota bacterium]
MAAFANRAGVRFAAAFFLDAAFRAGFRAAPRAAFRATFFPAAFFPADFFFAVFFRADFFADFDAAFFRELFVTVLLDFRDAPEPFFFCAMTDSRVETGGKTGPL